MRATTSALTLALLASLTLLSCSSPSAPTTYERIVIETFSPNGDYTADTYIDLFDASGDPDGDNPWTGDDTSDAIAWDDNGNPSLMSKIDYTGGLSSGTYYIRVRAISNLFGIDDYYAIRALSLQIGDSLPSYPTAADPLPIGLKPDSFEIDDNPTSGGVPSNPATIELGAANALSRTLYRDATGTVSDIDWFVLVLP